MDFQFTDFFGAEEYFANDGSKEWSEIRKILTSLPLQLQASDQAEITGKPIFDPKGTNLYLTEKAALAGWTSIPVPTPLKSAFGKDWDAGKRSTLVEWQFSNYPFLWNNIIRSHVVCANNTILRGMSSPTALLVVTKSACLPASNSTLYYEQALSQMQVVLDALKLSIAIRLVGLTIPHEQSTISADWNSYPARTSRTLTSKERWEFDISWRARNRGGAPYAEINL